MTTKRHSELSVTLPQPPSSWAVAVWLRNVFARLQRARRHTALILEFRSSVQSWTSHILETRQFLLDRGLKTHSLLMHFLPRRKIAFPSFSVLRVTYYLNALAWRSFFSHNFQSECDHGEGPHTHRERQANIQMSVPSIFSLGEIQGASVQFSSVTQSCPTLCDPMNHSTPGLPVHHQLPEFTQTHVHRVGDAIQPSHPLSSPSPPAPNPSQHQSLFQ